MVTATHAAIGKGKRMQLSPSFTLEEMEFSQTAERKGIDNTAPPEIVARLVSVAHQLEHVRSLFSGCGIRISSGYRCPDLNKSLSGSSRTSAHCEGWAVDFTVPRYGSPLDVAKKILTDSTIRFDQLIYEGKWIHISFKPTLRQEVLTAHFGNGTVNYTRGLA